MSEAAFSPQAAADSLNAAIGDAAEVRIFTRGFTSSGFGTLLVSFPISFAPALIELPSIASVQFLPVTATAVASGLAEAFRVVDSAGSIRWFVSGNYVNGVTDPNSSGTGFLHLSNRNIVIGDEISLTEMSLAFNGLLLQALPDNGG